MKLSRKVETDMRETMKEVVVTAPHKVEIREAPIPVPKDDEVLSE